MSSNKEYPETDKRYYRDLVAMVMNNDPEKKKKVDARARVQIAAVKEQLPDIDDETLVVFLVSIAGVMAKILSSPIQEAAEIIERMFDSNVVAAASIMEVYDIDGKEIPRYDPPAHDHDDAKGHEMTPEMTAELEKIINRQYL